MTIRSTFAPALALLMSFALAACGTPEPVGEAEHSEAEAEAPEGPHGGRLLSDGDFAVEMTIFEDGQEPQYRVYPYRDGKPVDPATVQLAVTLKRLGGDVDRFAFKPERDYLTGQGVVEEPHSFDVEVTAIEGGRRHQWRYASPEGRTRISAAAAKESGIVIARAGPASIGDTRELIGTVALAPTARAEVRARFPGKVMWVGPAEGDAVRAGQVVARVESNESLQVYAVTAPRGGIVAERNTNAGDVAGSEAMFVITDPAATTVEFNIFPRDLEVVRAGQRVTIETMDGVPVASGTISGFLPQADAASQTNVARVALPNPTGQWRPGMALKGRVTVNAVDVPLAVRTEALQRFRDFTVVFANYGEDYEVRMLELGRQTPEWTEVKSGIDPGTPYAAKGAFLIRADIEKSGASHDH